MKKFNLFILLFSLTVTLTAADPNPVFRNRHNGLFGIWYRVIEWDPGSILVVGTGQLCLKCHTPGSLRCLPTNVAGGFPADYDNIDRENCLKAFDYIDDQLLAKNFEGNYQLVVQVEGENFKRVYNATWTLGEKGEGIDRFWRTNVTF